ncbi:MAG: hypothetical protein ABH852_04580 [Methanobacteriota archaeon]
MAKNSSKKVDIIGLLSFGMFLLLVGSIFASTPQLLNKIFDFARDFHLQEVYPGVKFFAPSSTHPVLYNVVFQFCLIFAVLQVFILIARFVMKDSVGRKAETFSSIVFWLGAALALNYLVAGTIEWFTFLGWIIVAIGLSITVRSAMVLVFRGKG